jgi:hypothetical protein
MARLGSKWRVSVGLAACAAALFSGMGSARAFLTETSTLPLLGSPYTIGGGNCFDIAEFCVAGGEFTLTSVVPGGFVQSGADQFITADATAVFQLNNLSSVPIGTVTLTGTIEQEVLARFNQDDTGSWTVDLVPTSTLLTGTLDGNALTFQLNTAKTSSGTTSITPDGAFFGLNSFFDVFAQITYDVPGGPLTAFPSGTATATAAPEPPTLALLAGSLVVMSGVRRRRG